MIFDVDGTLVDSNDGHARAWVDALAEAGYPVPFERIRPSIRLKKMMKPKTEDNRRNEIDPAESTLMKSLRNVMRVDFRVLGPRSEGIGSTHPGGGEPRTEDRGPRTAS